MADLRRLLRLPGQRLGHVADRLDIAIDLLGDAALFFRRAGDLQVHLGDQVDRPGDALQCLYRLLHLADVGLRLGMAAVHRLGDFAGAGLQVVDHLADFLHRTLGTARQAANLVGHHGEAAALFAGAGGFDGGVEGEQVGLFGDGADHLQHLADLFAALGEVLHLLHRLAHTCGEVADAVGGTPDHV
ncbi:hypothetical protein D3C76_677600 [compost metagenome]